MPVLTSQGTDAAKKIVGRKRGVLTDTTALPVPLRFTSPEDAAVVSAPFNRDMMRDLLLVELFDRFFASVDRSAAQGAVL
jgi:hypothetical protein